MNRGRVQDQNIPTGVDELDSNNMPLIESLTREGILHNFEPVDPNQDTSHYVISLMLKIIKGGLMNNPTPLLTIKS